MITQRPLDPFNLAALLTHPDIHCIYSRPIDDTDGHRYLIYRPLEMPLGEQHGCLHALRLDKPALWIAHPSITLEWYPTYTSVEVDRYVPGPGPGDFALQFDELDAAVAWCCAFLMKGNPMINYADDWKAQGPQYQFFMATTTQPGVTIKWCYPGQRVS